MRPQPIDAFIMMSTNMMDVIIGNSGGVEGSNSIITYGHGKKVRGARGHLEKKRQRGYSELILRVLRNFLTRLDEEEENPRPEAQQGKATRTTLQARKGNHNIGRYL